MWTTCDRGRAVAADGSGLDDLDRDRELDVVVQLGGDGVGAEGLDRLDVQLLAVDRDVRLRLDRLGDVAGGDRAEELALDAGLRGDDDGLATSADATVCADSRSAASRRSRARRIDFGLATAPRWPASRGPSAAGSCGRGPSDTSTMSPRLPRPSRSERRMTFMLRPPPSRRRRRRLATSASSTVASTVGGVAAAAASSRRGRRSRRSSPSRGGRPARVCDTRLVYGRSAISRAFLTALATSRCCCTSLPVTRRLRILERSLTKRLSRLTSL